MTTDNNGMQDETRSFKILTPGTMISHYRILEKIGEGGMGVVYKAEDTRLKRTVALKFLPPRLLCDADARTRFEHEAQSASSLNHPNITTIYEIDDAEGRCFIAMEYIEGKSVQQAAAAAAASIEDILDMAIQVGKGLDAAHRKDVVHRDIKPDNIMVNNEGVVKITDFGLAKLKGVTKLTKEGTTVGTLQYMSPEQVLGKGVDRRSDIFSFGAVLYEMITGRLPFRGDDEAALINSILNESPEPLARYKANIPEGLQRIVDKALAKDREERYQHADEMVADLKRERRASESTAVTHAAVAAGTRKPRRRLLRILAPIIAVCIVVLLIFILEPFRIEVGPDKQAIAAENSLAVMYFENMVDPEDTDRTAKMMTALLITDLSESEYLEVMSRQRLFDILRALGKEDLKGIDESVASEVAKRAGVRWVLTGSVFQIEPNIVITSEISDANSGNVVASQRVTGEKGEDVFAVVDRLSRAIKDDMALPSAATSEVDRPVADVTTHSPEAYRYYMEGLDLFWKHYMDDAEASLRKALEYDSTFAMANWALSYVVDEPEKSDLLARAVRHSDKASDLERGYIRAMAARHAGDTLRAIEILTELTKRYPSSTWPYMSLGVTYRELGKPEKAAAALRALLEIDPLDKEAYNQLAYTYDDAGDLENAIWAINQYIALAPDEANPYDSRGDLYAFNSRLDEALESYRKASEIKPLFSTSREGAMYLFKREYARAESCFNLMTKRATPEGRANGRMMLALIPMYRGRFEEALRLLEDGLTADRMEQYVGMAVADTHRLMALIYMELGNSEAALPAARRCMEARAQVYPNDPAFAADFYMSTLYLTGHADQAESLAAPYVELHAEHPEKATQADFTMLGLRELARGNNDEGIRYLERSIEAGEPYLHLRVLTARACIDAGRLGRAVELLEAALKRYDYTRATTPIWSVKAHYWLGLAYEGSGWKDKAAAEYETFLDIWKDADQGIPAVEDARRRLEGLKQES
jgi:tetratricopeptide (TPR) repeat protein/predicted Ser/Thr protein kinase